MALAGRLGLGLGRYQVELVAFGVGEGSPADRGPVEASDGRRAQCGEERALGLEAVGAQVQVQAVLDCLGLGDSLEGKPGPAGGVGGVDRGVLGMMGTRAGRSPTSRWFSSC